MRLIKILPTCGLALGVALVLATSAFKEAPVNKSGETMYTFQYNAPSGLHPYSAANVENVANWSYTSSTSCNGTNVKACGLQVPESYVDDPTGSPTLDASINISATESSPNVAYVSGTDAGTDATISNKSN
ncbi:hypothetical protein [Arachidicoccus sp.]|uniref:hypothetical protein n=1 Tax=Arachidicoccus sp. TaxID=1872624 RepID=UPI003D260B84